MRLVDDGAQLVVGVVLRARGSGERHDATGRAHLDQLRAVLDLVAHRLADLLDTVGDPLGDGEREDARREALEHRRIQVAAARRDRVARRHDPWAGYPSRVDRAHERDVEQQTAGLHEQAEVADGREAGQQRAPATRDGAHQLHGRVVLDRAHVRRAVAAHEEVELHVHEPGQQRHVAELDDLGIARATTPVTRRGCGHRRSRRRRVPRPRGRRRRAGARRAARRGGSRGGAGHRPSRFPSGGFRHENIRYRPDFSCVKGRHCDWPCNCRAVRRAQDAAAAIEYKVRLNRLPERRRPRSRSRRCGRSRRGSVGPAATGDPISRPSVAWAASDASSSGSALPSAVNGSSSSAASAAPAPVRTDPDRRSLLRPEAAPVPQHGERGRGDVLVGLRQDALDPAPYPVGGLGFLVHLVGQVAGQALGAVLEEGGDSASLDGKCR